jgi:hypothetical protein
MKADCENYLDHLAEIAAGGSHEGATAHLVNCSECRRKLQELSQVLNALSRGIYHAPETLMLSAEAIMPEPVTLSRRRVFALLTQNTLGFSGARSASTDTFQVRYATPFGDVRQMILPENGGFEVLTSVDVQVDRVLHGGQELDVEGGRFGFQCQSLDETGFEFWTGDSVIVVPSVNESLPNESVEPDPLD